MNFDGADDEIEHKESWLAQALVGGIVLAVTTMAVLLGIAGGQAAAWTAGLGAGLVVLGALAGYRGSVGSGVLGIAIASLIVTHETSLAYNLAVNAIVAVLCVAVLAAADLSFVSRRSTDVATATAAGFAQVHALAAVTGAAVSVAALGVVLSIDWPGGVVLFPAVLITAASFAVAARAVKHNRAERRRLATKSQPPAPPRSAPGRPGPVRDYLGGGAPSVPEGNLHPGQARGRR